MLIEDHAPIGDLGSAALVDRRGTVDGLLAEEYGVARARQVGNFPQAFSHLALIDAAHALAGA